MKALDGLEGGAAEPLGESLRKGRLRSQKNEILTAQVALQRRFDGSRRTLWAKARRP